jgi:hypothetical protein
MSTRWDDTANLEDNFPEETWAWHREVLNIQLIQVQMITGRQALVHLDFA